MLTPVLTPVLTPCLPVPTPGACLPPYTPRPGTHLGGAGAGLWGTRCHKRECCINATVIRTTTGNERKEFEMVVAIDSGTWSRKRNWPSREQWAELQRSTYWDSETGCPFASDYSHRLSDYASAEEAAAAIDAVNDRLKTIRKVRREANKALGPLGRQPGESKRAYHRRLYDMTRSDFDRVIDSLGPDDQPFKEALKKAD